MNSARTIRALAALVASSNSGVIDNPNADSAVFVISIGGVTGTAPTLQVTVEGVDPESGSAYTILQSAVLNGAGTTVLKIGRGLAAVANASANDMLPKQFRLQFVLGGSASPTVTFSVGASLGGNN